jgi:hypothetical protein
MTGSIQIFSGNSFSDLYKNDIQDARYAFLTFYPTTAGWSSFRNNKKFFLQDGNEEGKKVGYDKVRQKEPWRIMSVLGDDIPGILVEEPRAELVEYWQETFGYSYKNMEIMGLETYCNELNKGERFDKIITLFPYDHILPERHAVNPDEHYYLLSKTALADMGFPSPAYRTYYSDKLRAGDVQLPPDFPYLVKTSHGLSGEGTYIVKNESDLNHCRREIRSYLKVKLLDSVVITQFVLHAINNYCVQFYVAKNGDVTFIGATNQLVSPLGEFLGGIIHYETTDTRKFETIILQAAKFVNQHGYFGVVGLDILEDWYDKLHVIDANIRVNGSTPLCLQKNMLMKQGKETAKYSSDYFYEGTLNNFLKTFKQPLHRKDFIILSAYEYTRHAKAYTDIYGIVAGENLSDLLQIEKYLGLMGLQTNK